MTKVTLSNVPNLIDASSATAAINANNAKIVEAIENTFSRDGTSPNTINAPMDMNGQQIINLPVPIGGSSPLRLQDLATFNGGGTIATIPSGGTTNQVLSKNSNNSYDIGWKNSVTSVGLVLPDDFTVFGSPVTSAGTLSATYVNTPTGTGSFVRATAPTLTTPVLGAATATSINKLAITAPTTSATLAIADGKTLTVSNTMTLQGTDGNTYLLPSTGTNIPSNTNTATFLNKTVDGNSNTLTVLAGTQLSGTVPVANGGTGVTTAAGEMARLREGTLYATLPAANFNITTDQAISITLPTGMTRYQLLAVLISNPSISMTTASGGIYTAVSKGGIAALAASTTYSTLTNSTAGTSGSLFIAPVTNTSTAFYNSTTLYFSLTTAQGAAATADITLQLRPLP